MHIPHYDEIVSAKLISYTQSFVEEVELDELIDLVAYCARISNPESQIKNLNNEKLVEYLIKHQHWSPLEMVDVTLLLKTTRDISHQAVRHVSFRPQEFSQRYSNLKDMGEGFCIREGRFQDHKNRQNSIPGLDAELQAEWERRQRAVIELASETYDWAVSNEIAKECARVVLPEGLTTTSYFFKGSIRSWIHYLSLRGANGTQKEHMQIAHLCADVISKVFPLKLN